MLCHLHQLDHLQHLGDLQHLAMLSHLGHLHQLESERLKHLDHLLHQLWSKVESSAQEEGRVMVACREYETFSEAKGGACSLRGVGAAWGVQLGKIGGAGADQGSADEA